MCIRVHIGTKFHDIAFSTLTDADQQLLDLETIRTIPPF